MVLPHEETLSKAKEDRFQLLSATRCNFSSIYSLYQDEGHTTAQRLENLARSCPPRYAFSDGLVTHRLWVINDPVAIEALREDFAGRKLYIADGHHRYETGLRYRDTLARQGAYLPGSQYILMTLTDMADPGLTVFPTHRLFRWLENFDSAAFLAACGEDFTLEAKSSREESQAALDSLFQQGRHAFALYDGKNWTVLALKDTAVMEKLLPEKSQAYRTLDVSILHSLVLEKLLGSMVYEGQSDCYIVRSNGDVVLSTETKTEITEQMANLFDYLQQNARVDKPYFDTMVQTLPQGGEGCVLFTMNSQKYYLIYQPLGLMDWSIIGIVPTGVVDAGMRRVQNATILVIALLGLLIMAGVVKIQRDAERNRRRELERRREKSDMMFAGMARVVERFAVCDLDRDRYQYHERHGEPLYPPEGSYQQMLEQISRKYVVLTDSENAKITQMLAPENLRRLIKTDNDSLKLEYAARDKSAFFMMTVVPMAWKGDRLTRVMTVSYTHLTLPTKLEV